MSGEYVQGKCPVPLEYVVFWLQTPDQFTICYTACVRASLAEITLEPHKDIPHVSKHSFPLQNYRCTRTVQISAEAGHLVYIRVQYSYLYCILSESIP